ncbi:16S rRNA (guanine(527)-N(7))-methyltransferase RsmG [Sphingomonas sp.]|uniref:16S rRNA (guanine(527)-N(7))-methyltransferase RsmG n=1 Tax=Sphingomonas sp. TaxID=28214 RepID=UPI003B00AA15
MKARFGVEPFASLSHFVDLICEATLAQNLISPSTVDTIWSRHVVDSAQLIELAGPTGTWVDVGTGGGFPGVVVAILRRQRTIMVEPRRLRADFLTTVARTLGLANAEIVARKVEAVADPAAVISARAVGSVEKLLRAASTCATTSTRWLLPRGHLDQAELTSLRARWAGEFHVKQSITDAASSILVIDGAELRR